jgi:hypothetical protein
MPRDRREVARPIAMVLIVCFHSATADAHGGGLDVNGCHSHRQRDGYSADDNPMLPRVVRDPPAVCDGVIANLEATSEAADEEAGDL